MKYEFNTRIEHFIGGDFIGSPVGFEVLNPSIEARIGEAPVADEALVDRAVKAAATAQTEWGKLPANARGALLRNVGGLIRENHERLAGMIAAEQGKTLPLAQMEVIVTAEYLDYMAEWGRRIEGEIITSDRPGENILLFRRPMGVVAGVLPWNFPLFMVARKAAPALISGNCIVINPTSRIRGAGDSYPVDFPGSHPRRSALHEDGRGGLGGGDSGGRLRR